MSWLSGGGLAVGTSGLIDVHHHFLPERYAEALRRSGNDRPDGVAAIPQWSEKEAIDLLDGAHIEKAYLSISSPGVLLDGCDAADLARIVNDEAAELVGRRSGRFGGFAFLPLPDVESSLGELT
jgi:hypothetical protein